MADLLVQLLNSFIDRKDPPGILSLEYPGDSMVLRFEWFGGEIRDYGYTKARWDVVWTRFNEYWKSIGAPTKENPWWAE